ncbi:MAG: flagellar hook-length control protein FliK [Proteobacteria bacterium]|nr:flagellar hook-length control protein FliK [Pseudomonadota bacterium]
MEDLTIKVNAVKDAATSGPNGRGHASVFAGLAGSFQDLLQNAGIRIENSLSALADRAGLTFITKRVEAVQPADHYDRQQANDGRDRFDDHARAASDNSDRAGGNRVERDDGYGRDHGNDHREDRGEVRDDDHGGSHADDRADDQGDNSDVRDDASSNEDQGDDQKSASDDTDAGDTAEKTGDSDGETQTAGDDDGTAVSAGTDAVAQAGISTGAMDSVLSGMLTGGEALSAEGQASDQGKVSSTEGQATANVNIAAAATEKISGTGMENMSSTAVENVSKATPASTGKEGGPKGNHGAQGGVNANTQAQSVANEHSVVVQETEGVTALTPIESQAAGLAKAMGDGNKAQVTISVTNEAQTLVSKPGAALTANTLINSEGLSQSSTGQNTGSHAQGGGSHNPAQQAQAGMVQNQAAQNTQAQAQTGASAKGLVQAQAVSGASGGTAHSGGGEGAAQVNAGGGAGQLTQQTQSQSAAEQANNTQKQAPTGRTVVDQISVKITKAIQGGNDKITIQLRPANMGRVEVKLELTKDNHLTALIIADNRETLELLKNDARGLQRALSEAGLQTNAGDLNFNLRGEDGQDQEGKDHSRGVASVEEDMVILDENIIEEAVIASDGRVLANGRIDVRA